MRVIFHQVAFFIAVFLVISIAGCKKDSSPTDSSATISGDLFPIVQGHLYVYNEYTTDVQGNKIAGTDHRVSTKVGPSVTIAGASGNILIDSIYLPNGQFSTLDTTNAARKGADGTIYFILPSDLLADFPVAIALPTVWLPFFQPSAGVGTSYTIFTLDTTVTYQSVQLQLQLTLTGVINQKESVAVPAGTYSAYRGELNFSLNAVSGSVTWYSQSGNVLKMWLYEDVGPVKTSWSALGTATNGSIQELVSKNF
jgi:hypothetical protein